MKTHVRDEAPAAAGTTLQWGSRTAKLTLTACILSSGLAFLDSSVISVAAPRIQDNLGGGLATMQWVFDSYLLTLGALVLVGGALGDLLGKRSVLIFGTAAFGVTSVLCGIAPNVQFLIAARALQGVAAALMVPTSLAVVNALFQGKDRGRAIGMWSGLSGMFTAVGPFVGGLLVETSPAGWRWVFLINIPLVAGSLWLAVRAIPDLPANRTAAPLRSQVDFLGGLLAVAGLALIVGPLIEINSLGAGKATALSCAGLLLLVALGFVEAHRARTQKPPPMISLKLFTLRTFSTANVMTFIVYGSLGVAFFLVTIALQQGLGYSPAMAGISGLPVTIVLALFSSRVGGLIPKIGARPLLTLGPLLMACGVAILAIIQPGESYWTSVFIGYLIFASGLVLVVAPVTTTALSEVKPNESGTASGINNAVARIGSLLAIILIPLAGGMALANSTSTATGEAFLSGYKTSMLIAAVVCVLGGVISFIGFRRTDGRHSND